MITYELIGTNGDHIYFDNTHNYMLLRDGLSGLAGVPFETDMISSPGQIGSLVASMAIEPREFSFRCVVLGNGRKELESKRQRLVRALNPLGGNNCVFIWNRADGSRCLLNCIPDSGTPEFRAGTAPNAKEWSCYVDMIAPDPCWYLDTESTYPLRGFTGGWSLPLKLPINFGGVGTTVSINNIGDTPTPCTIELRGKLVDPVITNASTGDEIVVRRTIEDGETLLINTGFGKKSVTHIDVDGVARNAMHYVTIGSRFFLLEPGNVKLRYTASEEGKNAIGYVRYTPRWLGL